MAYEEYKNSVGAVLYHLSELGVPLRIVEEIIFHGPNAPVSITFNGRPFAKYIWNELTNAPTFEFLGEFVYFNKLYEPKVYEN